MSKPIYKKEWVWLMGLNIAVAVITLLIENSSNLDLNVWTVQVLTAALSIARLFNKTSQDKENIRASLLAKVRGVAEDRALDEG